MINSNRNFDSLADKFSQNIYGTAKGLIRQAVLRRDLDFAMELFSSTPLTIFDAGAGNGFWSCELAKQGHRVFCCDISKKMITAAQNLARENGVTDKIIFFHGTIDEAVSHWSVSFDLILCHAVLEWVSEQQKLLSILVSALVPEGILSLMFYNRDALLFRNILLGNLDYVDVNMKKRKKKTLSPDHPLDPALVFSWFDALALSVLRHSGVRIFHDYMIDKTQPQYSFEKLLALELAYCQQKPYRDLGRYLHFLLRRDQKAELPCQN